jgi:hypothetical protein
MSLPDINNVNDDNAAQPRPYVQTITLPSFAKHDPQLWFIPINRQFVRAGIDDEDAKYEAVAASLDYSVSTEERDLLINKPEHEPYTTIKNVFYHA